MEEIDFSTEYQVITGLMHYQNWFEKNSERLSQGGLWMRGGEINTLHPSEFESRGYRALFVRLSSYLDTGYSFTHQLLYQLAAETPGVFPDLAYLPPPKDAEVFSKENVPWLLGTQTKRDCKEFDLIGFSNSIVQELINIPHFLKTSGIELSKSKRMEDPTTPLIILGGANALFSSCLWMDDALVDGVFVGESDTAVKKILEICRDGKANNLHKEKILSNLEEVPGFFQPDKLRKTQKSFALNLNKSQALEKGPVYFLNDQMGSGHLQISEGCPCFCSFCAETWERRPYRERNAQVLKDTALKMKASMGLDSIDIYSFNFNMHSEFYQIIWDLIPHFKQIGLKSQRFDLLAHDSEMLKLQGLLGKTSITCGLEGISPRLREYLNKNLSTDDLHKSLEAIFKTQARELKVFLISTGLEEEQDFEALSDFLEHLGEIKKRTQAHTRVIFSMTPLVRFPWTPLEFDNAFEMDHYHQIITQAAGRVKSAGFEFREAADLPEYWISQILIRAAKPEVSKAFVKAIEKSGFVYYREVSEKFRAALESELKVQGLDPSDLLRGFDLIESESKPWVQVNAGVKRDFLWKMNQKLQEYKETDYCLGRNWTRAKCSHCGGCPTKEHIRNIVLAKQTKPFTTDQFKERIRVSKECEQRFQFLFESGISSYGVPRKLLGVALARALMLSNKNLTSSYRGFSGAFWDFEEKPSWILGAERIDLVFSKSDTSLLNQLCKDKNFLDSVNFHLGDWGKLIGLAPENWQPKGIEINSPKLLPINEYLQENGLKFTLRKKSEGHYQFDLIPQAIKKGVMTHLEQIQLEKSKWNYNIQTGPKFDWQKFDKGVLHKTKGLSYRSMLIRSF